MSRADALVRVVALFVAGAWCTAASATVPVELFEDGFESGNVSFWSSMRMQFVVATPYLDPDDIALVGRVFCTDGSCPWGSGYHDGVDYVTDTDLIPFRAASDARVSMVDSFVTGAGNRQVNVILELDDAPGYGLVYAFEPMTPDHAGQQSANVFVTVGQTVSAGDLIGNLVFAPAVGSHVHWGVMEQHQQTCPVPFLADAVTASLLQLIRRDTPGGEICY